MSPTATDPFLAAERFLATMGGPPPSAPRILVEHADSAGLAAHRQLRHRAFVEDQALFAVDDADDLDGESTTVVLVARRPGDDAVLGGVRLHPHEEHGGLGWWRGSRLVVAPDAPPTVAPALVRAATATAIAGGAVRFDATVQPATCRLFERLGWSQLGDTVVGGRPHVLMVAGSDRWTSSLQELKGPIGRLVGDLAPGGSGFVGDDGAPVPGSGLVAACDAILPGMVERDPYWAGWCAVLVNVNDLAAMGATPVGLLDAVAGRTEAHVAEVVAGLRDAAAAYGVAVLGGHTQLGQHASLAVTALGRAERPVPGGGGRPGDSLSLVADLGGRWRPGYRGRQWDSTTHRHPDELRGMVAALAGDDRPRAAKDVSMAGLVGTVAMLAEASGTGADVEVAAVPRPEDVDMADWLGCFPGFALVTADRAGRRPPRAAPATSAVIGRLTDRVGSVRLRWPDGHATMATAGAATGLGPA